MIKKFEKTNVELAGIPANIAKENIKWNMKENEEAMKNGITNYESNKIYEMKAFSILLVICAHCGTVSTNASSGSQIISELLGNMGSLGVPVFFFLSGYLFRYRPALSLLKRKAESFLCPWIVTGTLVYFYVHLRKGGFSLSSFGRWLIGDGSYLWFMSITAVFIIIGEILMFGVLQSWWKKNTSTIVLVIVSLGVNLLEITDIVNTHPYLDIFRWLWLFALGILIRDFHCLNYFTSMKGIFFSWILVLLLCTLLGININYWSYNWYLFSVLTILLFSFNCVYEGKLGTYLIDIGRKSFSIYLLHMPVAGVVTNLCNRINDRIGIITFLRPFIVLGVTYCFIAVVEELANKLDFRRWMQILIGSR